MKAVFDVVVNVLVACAAIVVIAVGIRQQVGSSAPSAAARATAPDRRTAPAVEKLDGLLLELSDAITDRRNDARLALVEFSDYQCPYCARYAKETLSQIRTEYVDSGEMAYVFLSYPLESIHPRALRSAEASECAAEQDRFWNLHAILFANQRSLEDSDLLNYAVDAGLHAPTFTKCFTEGRSEKVRRQMREASRLGVTSTPTFFLGEIEGGQIRLHRRLKGALPLSTFKTAVAEVKQAYGDNSP